MSLTHRPMTLIILDGWGHRENPQANAIAAAKKPYWDYLWQHYPHVLISGSGHAVGLPEDQMGNSEVGHTNMGAGRIVHQDLTRIDEAITNGDFFTNSILCQAIDIAVARHKKIHVLGLLSPGGVHSHEKHIHAFITLAMQRHAKEVFIHAFLDGRDTPPKSALASLEALQKIPGAHIASLIGRYYAMDRDKRWERVEACYDLLTEGKALFHAADALTGLHNAYQRGETDEFVQATTIHPEGQPPTTLDDSDVVIFMNFRADRARQITHALTDKQFSGFQRHRRPVLSAFVTLTEYDKNFSLPIAFPPEPLNNIFADYISHLGLTQLRIAETEKYAHVTFFFNGGVETPFPKEDRVLIPSPKVKTYDQQPEMSAYGVTEKLIEAIQSKKYDVIICNFANPDMVGHTGNFSATVRAIEVMDDVLSKIIPVLQAVGGEAIITADHGNAEYMFNETTQQPHTAHTHELVPCLYIGRPARPTTSEGILSDIAPTLLYLMGLSKPAEMTGRSLMELT